MKDFFCRVLMPWRAAAQFDELEEFYGFLLTRNKHLGRFRNVLFVATVILLLVGYALPSEGGYSIADFANQPFYLIAVGVLVVALLISVVMIQNEKQLPPNLRETSR